MSTSYEQQSGNEDLWKQVFGAGHPDLVKQHRFHARLPRDPRCKLCFAPFEGLGGFYLRFKGKGRSSRNPNFCNACDGFLEAFPGGAEVEMSMIFVDVRNSTAFAQDASPTMVSARINAFLDAVTQTIIQSDGFLLAFYGDCVVAVWPPGFSGPDHARKALGAARALVRDKTVVDDSEDPIPFGVGVHCGPVFIGTIQAAKGLFRDVSVFGHNVNLTARLAGKAAPSRALVSAALMTEAGEDIPQKDILKVSLKGIAGKPTVVAIGYPHTA